MIPTTAKIAKNGAGTACDTIYYRKGDGSFIEVTDFLLKPGSTGGVVLCFEDSELEVNNNHILYKA